MMRRTVRRLAAVFRRGRLSRDIAEELRAHVELEAASLRAQGLDEREARRLAGVSFGGWDATLEATREVHGMPRVDAVWREMRQALRALVRTPGFALAAMAVLGLGIGAATAAYGIAQAVLLRPLPYPDEARLYSVYEADSALAGRRPPSWPTVRGWNADTRAFEGIAYVRGESVGVRSDGGTILLLAAYPTADLFDVLRIDPALGRVFDDDEVRSGEHVAVLSWHLWRDQFGGDPAVVGRTLQTDLGPVAVIGVMPEGVRYPSWADLWLPQGALPAASRAAIERRDLHVDAMTVARLAPGVAAAEGAAELRAFNENAAAVHPDARGWTNIDMRSVRTELLGDARGRIALLGGATLLLLLIACANVAGLLVARSAARNGELSVRAALGASRRRLAGQLLAESVLLALGGGALGVAIAWSMLRIVATGATGALPRLETAHLEPGALLFGLGVSVATVLLFGLLPALRAGRAAPMAALRSSRGSSSGPGDERLRATLVIAEIALAATLVVGATSLAAALLERTGADLGFRTRDLYTIRVLPPLPRYASPDAALDLYRRVSSDVGAVRGVEAVALVNHLPLSGTTMPTDVRTARAPGPDERPAAFYRAISANYFDTLEIGLTRGRAFTEDEVASRAPVVVVNEALAAREWPGEDPLGASITVRRVAQGRADFGDEMTLTVVGVSANARTFGPGALEPPVVYVPYTLAVWQNMFVVAKGTGLRAVVRDAIARIDADIPVAGPGFQNRVRPFEDYASSLLSAGRLNTTLLGGFAAIALLLASVGLFGVIAYVVLQRRREFGVRFAIGASQWDIMRLVLVRSLRMAALGIAIGFLAAVVAGRLLGATQPDLARLDPAAFAVAATVFATAALLASALPALRAARVAPARILREDG